MKRLTLDCLQSVFLRSLRVPSAKSNTLPSVYYLLVKDRVVVYKSELARSTLNPIWLPIELQNRYKDKYQYVSQFSLEIVVVDQNETVLLKNSIEMRLEELEPLPVPLTSLPILPPNSLVLELNDGLYISKDLATVIQRAGVVYDRMAPAAEAPTVPLQLETWSKSIKTITLLQEKFCTTVKTLDDRKKCISDALDAREKVLNGRRKRNELKLKSEKLRIQLSSNENLLSREICAGNQEDGMLEEFRDVAPLLTEYQRVGDRIGERRTGVRVRRTEVLRTAHQIRTLQAGLVRHLRSIYPIDYVGAGEYSIRGIKMFNSDLVARDEEQVSTALGFIAHLVFMLSKYLQVPLRYHIVHFSSRSFVKDKVQGIGGEYPLYRRGVERERFEKAVLYLNRNVQQLVCARGLNGIDERVPILARLKALIDAETHWLETLHD